MEKNCLYCQVPFTTNREDKKYCKENCKQMAYLKRNGLKQVRSGKLNELNLHSNKRINDQAVLQSNIEGVYKPNAWNDVNDISSIAKADNAKQNGAMGQLKDTKQEEVKPVDKNHLSVELIKDLERRLIKTMDQKLEIAIQEIREEFLTKTQIPKPAGTFFKKLSPEVKRTFGIPL